VDLLRGFDTPTSALAKYRQRLAEALDNLAIRRLAQVRVDLAAQAGTEAVPEYRAAVAAGADLDRAVGNLQSLSAQLANAAPTSPRMHSRPPLTSSDRNAPRKTDRPTQESGGLGGGELSGEGRGLDPCRDRPERGWLTRCIPPAKAASWLASSRRFQRRAVDRMISDES
jgi:hypothetical protein